MEEHDGEKTPISSPVEPRHGDGERRHLQQVHREGLSGRLSARDEEKGEMPACPNNTKHDGGAREAKVFDLVFMGAPYPNRIGFFEKLFGKV